jgi:6-phospho-beta-glucosidase
VLRSPVRIAVVGGGSRYAVGLCESLVDYARDVLPAQVTLLDVDRDHLQMVHRFAKRLAGEAGADIGFEATTDRRKAFDGADFILTTFRPGSHREQELDERVPPTHGLQGNETIGVGGIFMACRVAPVLREMLADAEDLCPDAWIVNYTNPTQYVADIVQRISPVRIISLCDGQVDVHTELAHFLEVEPSSIEILGGGMNHAIWVMRFTVDGQDGYPLLRERLARFSQEELDERYEAPDIVQRGSAEYPKEEVYGQFILHHKFSLSLRLFALYGLLPGPRYYPRYLMDQDALIAEQRTPGYMTMAGFYMKHVVPRAFDDLDQRSEHASLALETTRKTGGGGHGDLAVRVISAIANDLNERFMVNVTNAGAISNLPADAVLELSALVGRTGAHPFAMGPLPETLVGLQHALVLSQQLSVDAALSGSRTDLLKAIVAHPLITSLDAAERCMDELLVKQAAWLPQFQIEGAVS